MPKFRGLPRRKKPDYLGPKQQRYNTPHAVGDWITRPSRGNRKWSFFLRGKREQGLRFQIDRPEEVRRYRSFRRMWCRSLNLDPISFVPVSSNGQARGWRFLSPSSNSGYWEVVAIPADSDDAVFCVDGLGPKKACISYIDSTQEVQTVCTTNLGIHYKHEDVKRYRVSLNWNDPDTSTFAEYTIAGFDPRANLSYSITKTCDHDDDSDGSSGGADDEQPSVPRQPPLREFSDRRVVPWPEATAYVLKVFSEIPSIKSGDKNPYGFGMNQQYPLCGKVRKVDIKKVFYSSFSVEVPIFNSPEEGTVWENSMIEVVNANLESKIGGNEFDSLSLTSIVASACRGGVRTWGFGVGARTGDSDPVKSMVNEQKPFTDDSDFLKRIKDALEQGGFKKGG